MIEFAWFFYAKNWVFGIGELFLKADLAGFWRFKHVFKQNNRVVLLNSICPECRNKLGFRSKLLLIWR